MGKNERGDFLIGGDGKLKVIDGSYGKSEVLWSYCGVNAVAGLKLVVCQLLELEERKNPGRR